MNVKRTGAKNQVTTVNIFEQQELLARVEAVKSNLKASTCGESCLLYYMAKLSVQNIGCLYHRVTSYPFWRFSPLFREIYPFYSM